MDDITFWIICALLAAGPICGFLIYVRQLRNMSPTEQKDFQAELDRDLRIW